MFNMWVRAFLFLPYKDTQCGAKIFRKNALNNIIDSLSMSQWVFDVDLIYQLKKRGFRLNEVSTNWFDRGGSTINFWQAGPKMALGVIRLRLLNSPFKDFMRLYKIWKNQDLIGKNSYN